MQVPGVRAVRVQLKEGHRHRLARSSRAGATGVEDECVVNPVEGRQMRVAVHDHAGCRKARREAPVVAELMPVNHGDRSSRQLDNRLLPRHGADFGSIHVSPYRRNRSERRQILQDQRVPHVTGMKDMRDSPKRLEDPRA